VYLPANATDLPIDHVPPGIDWGRVHWDTEVLALDLATFEDLARDGELVAPTDRRIVGASFVAGEVLASE
jgi:hypothetical protein